MIKKLIITCSLLVFFIPSAFSQNGEQVDGGDFLKRVEYNLYALNLYNLQSKGDIEKLFFGDFNAPFEFFYDPSFEASTKDMETNTFKESKYVELLNNEQPVLNVPAQSLFWLKNIVPTANNTDRIFFLQDGVQRQIDK